MKLPEFIWTTTGVIVTVAIVTQTNILKNLINKVKNPPHGFAGPSFGSSTPQCYGNNNEPMPCGFDGGGGGGGGVGQDMPSRGSTRQSWGSGNFPGYFYFDPIADLQEEQQQQQQEPNFTQPLVTPEQARKNTETEHHHKKKKKHHYSHDNKSVHPTTADENLDYQHSQYNPYVPSYQQPGHDEQQQQQQQQQQVYTQVECPDDPNTLPCGATCYHDGRLWQVSCAQPQPQPQPSQSNTNEDLTNTVPIHTVPALTYPEDTSTALPPSQSLIQGEGPTTPYYYNPYRSGGPSPKWPIPTGPGSSPQQNSIHPTTSEQNYADQQKQYNPNLPSHAQTPPGSTHKRLTPTPVSPPSGVGKRLTILDHTDKRSGSTVRSASNPGGCYRGNTGITCRVQGDTTGIPQGTSYGVYGVATTGPSQGEGKGHGGGGVEITSGGPGSSGTNCCGITTGIHNDGSFYIATEDWRQGLGINGKHTYLCSNSPHDHNKAGPQPVACTGGQNFGNIYNTTIPLSWHVDYSGGHTTYCGRVDNQAGCAPGPGLLGSITDPVDWMTGRPLIPNNPISQDSHPSDPTRMRVDGASDSVIISPLQVYNESDSGYDDYY